MKDYQAVFAMPVFNWDGEGVPVVSKGFGYYWAVTVPLTVLVLVSWGLSMLLPWRDWMSRFKKIAKRDDTELAVTLSWSLNKFNSTCSLTLRQVQATIVI